MGTCTVVVTRILINIFEVVVRFALTGPLQSDTAYKQKSEFPFKCSYVGEFYVVLTSSTRQLCPFYKLGRGYCCRLVHKNVVALCYDVGFIIRYTGLLKLGMRTTFTHMQEQLERFTSLTGI